MMAKILVIGAKGQVGVDVCTVLAGVGHSVVGLGSAELDVCSIEAVTQAVVRHSPGVIVNCSAYTAVDKAEQERDKAYQVNVVGPKNLAVVSSQFDVPVIHISTDYVFDGSKSSAYMETDPAAPLGVYGKTKLGGELALTEGCVKHIVLRTSWVFGLHGGNFVKTILRLAKDRDTLDIIGDQVGAPTYAGDIAGAVERIVLAIGKSNVTWGVYHYAGQEAVSWADFARSILSESGDFERVLVRDITTAEYAAPAPRPLNSRLDCSKIIENFDVALSDWRQALPMFVRG